MAELNEKDLQQVDGGFIVPDSEKEYEYHIYKDNVLTPEELKNVSAGANVREVDTRKDLYENIIQGSINNCYNTGDVVGPKIDD